MAASNPIHIRSAIGGIPSEALILIAGILTSLATVVINAIAAHVLEFNFLSLFLWLIVPVGAILGGVAAASGYYFMAVRTDTMPSKTFLLEMVGIAVSTWFLVQWVDYATAQFSDGSWVQAQVSFWDFFQYQAAHTQLTIRSRAGAPAFETGNLGGWGYAREAVQLFGFMMGGCVVWVILSDREVCEKCRKYAKTESLFLAQPPIRLQDVLDESKLVFPNIVEDAQHAIAKSRFVGMDLNVARCPQCFAAWARPAVALQSRNDVYRRKLKRYMLTAEQATALRRACAATAT